jgi:predicted nucleic acid-binding protein
MIVLDASALVDVVTEHRNALAIIEHLDQPLVATGHQQAEVLSAVARLVRADELSAEEARQALVAASDLEQEVVVATGRHLRRALELQDRIRVLDGLYVALAEQLGAPLLTTDARLVGSDPPCDVILAVA